MSLLRSHVSCLSQWARQNFPERLKIEKKLCLVSKKNGTVFTESQDIEDFTQVVISYEIYETSLRRVS